MVALKRASILTVPARLNILMAVLALIITLFAHNVHGIISYNRQQHLDHESEATYLSLSLPGLKYYIRSFVPSTAGFPVAFDQDDRRQCRRRGRKGGL
jgi:hypothetical protein